MSYRSDSWSLWWGGVAWRHCLDSKPFHGYAIAAPYSMSASWCPGLYRMNIDDPRDGFGALNRIAPPTWWGDYRPQKKSLIPSLHSRSGGVFYIASMFPNAQTAPKLLIGFTPFGQAPSLVWFCPGAKTIKSFALSWKELCNLNAKQWNAIIACFPRDIGSPSISFSLISFSLTQPDFRRRSTLLFTDGVWLHSPCDSRRNSSLNLADRLADAQR